MRNHSLSTLSRPFAGLVFAVLIALAPTACRKEPGPPSEDYDQANQLFRKLYAQKLDDAFVDPGMDRVEELLAQVPPDSMDAQPARELQQRITQGRERKEKARQDQEAAIASAHEVDPTPGSAPSRPEPEPAPEPAAPPDAGPPPEGPVQGTPASELTAGYLGCFQQGKSINVDGRGSRDSWEMADRARCNQSYPRFVGQVVIVEDGKVLTVLPKSALRVTYQAQDGGPIPGR